MAKRYAFTGDERYPIAMNMGVINGVVDNGHAYPWQEDYSNWESEFVDEVVINNDSVTWDSPTGNRAGRVNIHGDVIKDNTQYTMEYRISNSTFLTSSLSISSLGITNGSVALEKIDGTYSVNFITDNPIADNFLRIVSITASAETLTFELLKIYETALGDNSQDQPTVENSITPEQLIQEWSEADVNEYLHDNTDPVNPTTKVVAIDDLEPDLGDQWFIDLDDDGNIIKSGFFNEPLVSPCLEKAQKYFNTTINFNTSDDEVFTTSDGEDFHVVP